jgi:hypothetical protein
MTYHPIFIANGREVVDAIPLAQEREIREQLGGCFLRQLQLQARDALIQQ